MAHSRLKAKIREVPDFPTPGVVFKDITPLLEDAVAFGEVIQALADFFRDRQIDKVLCIDARGFLLGSAVAYILNAGIVMARKKGKLPYVTVARDHDLEYGRGTLEIHIDSIKKGERVLVIDDVLATGGTAEAAVFLAEKLGGIVVGLGFLLELPLGGRERLAGYDVRSLISY